MKRSRVTDEQVVAILREREVGGTTIDACRRHGIGIGIGIGILCVAGFRIKVAAAWSRSVSRLIRTQTTARDEV